MSLELNPPILKSQGLDAALIWLSSHMQDSYGLKIDLSIGQNIKNFSDERTLMLIQMIKELLVNVVKHSGVLETTVEATSNTELIQVSVQDNGKGFDHESIKKNQTNWGYLQCRSGLIS